MPVFSLAKEYQKGSERFFQDTTIMPEVVFVYSYVDTARYLYTYNSNGNERTETYQTLLNRKWGNVNRTTNIYDSNGNLFTVVYEIMQNGIWATSFVKTYEYGLNNKLSVMLSEYWNNGTLSNRARDTYSYDSTGREIFHLNEAQIDSNWVDNSRYTTSYNLKGIKLLYLCELWSNGQWHNSEKYTYNYDSIGNQTFYEYEQWGSTKIWSGERHSYTYDTNSNIITSIFEEWNFDNWYNKKRNTCTYDLKRNNLTNLTELWNNEQWVNYNRSIDTYDTNSRKLSELFEVYSGTSGKWNDSSFTTFFYSTDGSQDSSLTKKWINDQWVNDTKNCKTFDFFGNKLTDLTYMWMQWNDWQHTSLYTNTFDSTGKVLSMSYDSWTFGQMNFYNTILSFYNSKGEKLSFNGTKIVVAYTGITLVPEEQTINSLSLFCSPNPASGIITINYSISEPGQVSLSLTNSLGIVIAKIDNNQYQEAGYYSLNYDTEYLSPGVYFLTIKAGNKVETMKVVVIR